MTRLTILDARAAALERESNEAIVRGEMAIADFDQLDDISSDSCEIHRAFATFIDKKVGAPDKVYGRNHAMCGMVVETEEGDIYKYSFKSKDPTYKLNGVGHGEKMVDIEMLDTQHRVVADRKTTSHCHDATKMTNEEHWIKDSLSSFAAIHHHTEQVVVNIFIHNMTELVATIASDKTVKNVTYHMHTETAPSDEDIKAFMNLKRVIAERYKIDKSNIKVCISFKHNYVRSGQKSVSCIMAEEHDEERAEDWGEEIDRDKSVYVVRSPEIPQALSVSERAEQSRLERQFGITKGSVIRRKLYMQLGNGISDTSDLTGNSGRVFFTMYDVGQRQFRDDLPVKRELDPSIEDFELNKPEDKRTTTEGDLLRALAVAAARQGSRGLVTPSAAQMSEYYYRDNNIVARLNASIDGIGGYEAQDSVFLLDQQDGYKVAVLSPADGSHGSRSPISSSINEEFKSTLRDKMSPISGAQEDHIKILMPVSIGLAHWYTLEIKAVKQPDNTYIFNFTIHDPLIRSQDMSDARKEGIRDKLRAAFGNILQPYQAIHYQELDTPKRQRDGYGCGVIATRDIEALILGNGLPYIGLNKAGFDTAILSARTEDRHSGYVSNAEITGANVTAFLSGNSMAPAQINREIVEKAKNFSAELNLVFAHQNSERIPEYRSNIIHKFFSLQDHEGISDLYKDFFEGELSEIEDREIGEGLNTRIARVVMKHNVLDTMREIGIQAIARNDTSRFEQQEVERQEQDQEEKSSGILGRGVRAWLSCRAARASDRVEEEAKMVPEDYSQENALFFAAEPKNTHPDPRAEDKPEDKRERGDPLMTLDQVHRHIEGSRREAPTGKRGRQYSPEIAAAKDSDGMVREGGHRRRASAKGIDRVHGDIGF